MSSRCKRVVSINDDDRLARPIDILCGEPGCANVTPGRDHEWVACELHAAEAERDRVTVERWD